MRGVAPVLVLLGCTPVVPENLAGVPLASARIEGVGGAGMLVVVGGWSGSGELHAVTSAGEELVLPVELAAGAAGALVEMAWVPGSTIELDLPRQPVTGDDLFGTYKGVREAAVILVGAVGVHLQNEAGVRIDETQLALGLGLHVSWSWLSLSLHVEDTGFSFDTGAPEPTGFVPYDTGEASAHTGAR